MKDYIVWVENRLTSHESAYIVPAYDIFHLRDTVYSILPEARYRVTGLKLKRPCHNFSCDKAIDI